MPKTRLEIVPVTPLGQNCSILWDESSRRAVVCDPGGDVPRILERVNVHGLLVEALLLTHGHFDHAGGADELRAALPPLPDGTRPPLLGPDRRDAFLLADLEQTGLRFGILGGRNVEPDQYLSEGDTLELAGCRLSVLHVPGHTPGHIVFVDTAQRFGLVGDTLFRGSIGRTDFPYSDGDALLRGIRDKLLPLGDDLAILPGHGSASTIGDERQTNPFLR